MDRMQLFKPLFILIDIILQFSQIIYSYFLIFVIINLVQMVE